jgi:hypothetical protein
MGVPGRGQIRPTKKRLPACDGCRIPLSVANDVGLTCSHSGRLTALATVFVPLRWPLAQIERSRRRWLSDVSGALIYLFSSSWPIGHTTWPFW